MPRIPLDHACDLEAILTPLGRSYEKVSNSYALRVYVARNLAMLLKELHSEQHYVVDMKPKNFSVYKSSVPGLVAMLDTDGFSINFKQKKRYPAEMASSEYMAPEMMQKKLRISDAGEMQDRWALAVILFRLLNEGIHPYLGSHRSGQSRTIDENVGDNCYAYGVARNPSIQPNKRSIHEYFEPECRRLFDRGVWQKSIDASECTRVGGLSISIRSRYRWSSEAMRT